MKVGFFEKAPGEKSMIRLGMFLSVIAAIVVIVWGMSMVNKLVNSVVDGNTVAVTVIGSLVLVIGGALTAILGSTGLKVLQQRGEAKDGNSPTSLG